MPHENPHVDKVAKKSRTKKRQRRVTRYVFRKIKVSEVLKTKEL